ncbi:hypothetical protein V6N11_057782 [Hibiscus sabdariffa]|uniref:Uncharacterized protein n=1 Tax=Hibiscus sabdariffa TaxID=183260 RepID=A0ABR1ZW00_9ROSI
MAHTNDQFKVITLRSGTTIEKASINMEVENQEETYIDNSNMKVDVEEEKDKGGEEPKEELGPIMKSELIEASNFRSKPQLV